ncbi:MAG: PAS domain S-box protein [Desulfobacteraceae bacterium]|nr:PAS domain S-box protein [Desulfobacteraceae bacterium]MBC2756366.1 PAS domain S-box protein [Desulfobacteraceae bacterium]
MDVKPTYEELEKALQKSEKKFRDFYENSVMGLFQTEIDGRLLMLNRKCAEIFGYDSPALALEAVKNVNDIYVYPEKRLQLISDIKKNGFIRDVEIECKKSNGDLFWINLNTIKSVEEDGSIFFNGILSDITERKFAEAELKKFKTISDQANYGTTIVDLDGNFIYINENFALMHGFYPDELAEKNLEIFHTKEQMGHVDRLNEKLVNEGGYSAEEVWHVRKDGSVFPTIMNGYIIKKDDGSPYLMAATAIDITDRKLAEEALKKSEAKYRLICNKIPIGIFHYDKQGVITVCNEQSAEIAGTSIENLIDFNLLENLKNEHMLTAVKDSLDGKTRHLEGKYSSVTGDKTTYTKSDFIPLISDGDFVEGGIGVVEDVTEKIMAAKALRESQHQLKSIINNASAVIYLKDKQGKFILINRQFETLFHITQEEIFAKTDYDIFPREISDRLKENDLKVIEAGMPLEFEENVLHDDGIHTYISIKFPIQDASGTTYGVCGISSDISDRKQAEEELTKSHEKLRNLSVYLQSAREQERTHIAREVHDDLGQALTAIKLDLSWLKEKIPKKEKTVVKKAEKTIALVHNAIKSVQRIISELRPGLLNDLGLAAAMEWQIKEFEERTGIKTDMTIDPEEPELDNALSTTIFRIFQETLTNITRHSQATCIKVRLKERDGIIELIVRDNGVGITEDQIAHRDSFGLMGMMERAHAAGGEIKISGNPGRGTMMAVHVPVKK